MDDRDPLRNYTFIGRLWMLICVVGAMVVTIIYVVNIYPSLAPGTYPLLLFWVPVGLGTLIIYALGIAVFRLLGIKHRKSPDDQTH
jgi:hypothetical protein